MQVESLPILHRSSSTINCEICHAREDTLNEWEEAGKNSFCVRVTPESPPCPCQTDQHCHRQAYQLVPGEAAQILSRGAMLELLTDRWWLRVLQLCDVLRELKFHFTNYCWLTSSNVPKSQLKWPKKKNHLFITENSRYPKVYDETSYACHSPSLSVNTKSF